MCVHHKLAESTNKAAIKTIKPIVFYMIAIVLAIVSGVSGIKLLENIGSMIAEIFINMFKCVSLPIIASSIIVTISQYNNDTTMSRVWQRTLLYTLTTTFIAATLACVLYVVISPASPGDLQHVNNLALNSATDHNYFHHLVNLIPTNILQPFLEHSVISVLLLGVIIGIAIRNIKNVAAQNTMVNFFKAIHEILLFITGWMIKVVPFALYGFITVTVLQLKNGVAIKGLAAYISIIVLANLIQGLVILPLWLFSNRIAPIKTMKGMLPALTIAFFSKSSAGTLPVTMEAAEKNINVDPKISRFVLPLCTTINMNGCAAFIFVTVIYLMQTSGITITATTLLTWIVISTIAAIGNAGIPMGCFFISASLLASMNVPITILGLILPFYSLIDMLETALNVWSDACVTKVVDHKESAAKISQEAMAT